MHLIVMTNTQRTLLRNQLYYLHVNLQTNTLRLYCDGVYETVKIISLLLIN